MTEAPKIDASLLIVEDEPDLLLVLRENLSTVCETIYVASNGLEALGVIKANPTLCAILSDINMPIMDGLALLANVRKSFNPIPFIVLTAYGDSNSYREAIRLNATDFLAKPFQMSTLEEAVRRALAYGSGLLEAERELDAFFCSSNLPPEKLEAIRRAKRTAMAMRIESSIYLKKIAS